MKVGILGGGQLAKMLIEASKPLDLEFCIFTPTITDTTKGLAKHIEADFNDHNALKDFADSVDVITYETESIPLDTIRYLDTIKPVTPSAKAIEKAQDRLLEKTLFHQLNIPTNEFIEVNNADDLQQAAKTLGMPFIVKSRRGGYDGKNQWRVKTETDLNNLMQQNITDAIAESFVPFDREVSIIAVRNHNNDIRCYPLCENVHRDGILRMTTPKPNDPLFEAANGYANKMLNELDYVGVICIEFFVKDNQLLANELAPRVHNSGHWSIEGAHTSQFENHLRAICGLPLGNPTCCGHSCMINIIGEFPDQNALKNIPHLYLHDYLKTARKNRKLGHVTLFTENKNDLDNALRTLMTLGCADIN